MTRTYDRIFFMTFSHGKTHNVVVQFIIFILLVALVVGIWGCPAAKEIRKDDAAVLKPELTITIGSVNYAAFNRKLEKKDVSSLVRILKREQIEVLAVQSIVRYPGLETRVDFVKEFAAQADLRQVFGEMVESGGKQTGNALFSAYPIRSNNNIPLDAVRSAKFTAALIGTIDGGVRDISVASVQLPVKQSQEDASACMALVANELPSEESMPVVLAGNLPENPQGRFSEFRIPSSKNPSARIWYTPKAGLEVVGSRTVESEFGPITILQLGLYRQVKR